jgi:tripartite-type tricarboxylate transporter receptor subunit TctC
VKGDGTIKKFAVITGGLILSAIIAATGCPPPAEEAKPAEFYTGKTIDFVIPHSAGAFNDIVGRIIAPYLNEGSGAHAIISNREGAGGLEGINYIYRAEPDGLTLGVMAVTKLVPNKVLDEPAADYELEKFSYIMSITRRLNVFLIAPDGPCQSIADLQAGTNLKFGAGSPSGPMSLGGLTIIKFLGLDAKVVTGIGTEEERALATKRGEIVGYVQSTAASQGSIKAGLVKPLFILATERDSLRPDVPAITELVNLSDEDLVLARLWDQALVNSCIFAASPGIPADRLAFLRNLADQWVQDKAFREEIDLASGHQVRAEEYITGAEVTQNMLDTAANLGQFQAMFADMIERYRA